MITSTFPPLTRQIQHIALWIGIAGLGLSFFGAYLQPRQFFLSYLFAYLFWTGISLGAMIIIMIHHLTGGVWGFLIRRPLEAATQALPLMALLFIPLLFGLSELYIWTRPEDISHESVLQVLHKKREYLNIPFFVARAVIYFVIWLGIAYWLNKWSGEQDQKDHPEIALRLQYFSAIGAILYTFSITFAGIDWIMSLVPEWYSTIFGFLFGSGQMLSAMAFAIIAAVSFSKIKPLGGVFLPGRLNDLGNILLVFILLWTYLAFMQYFIIWSENLPHEISWYLPRVESSWKWVGIFLIAFHFFVPFIVLLSRRAKRTTSILVSVAAAVMVVHLVDTFWLVVPSLRTQGFQLYWTDFAVPLGIGGLWLATVLWRLQRKPLVPLQAPGAKRAMKNGK